jgi:hypothetical protein
MEKAFHNDGLVIGKMYEEGFRLLQALPRYLPYNNLPTFLSIRNGIKPTDKLCTEISL